MALYQINNSSPKKVSIDKNDLLEYVYPIGSIYMSVSNVSPASFLGGTWVVWGSGRVPVGVDTNDTAFDTVEETGGEKVHTLTGAESGQKNLGTFNSNNTGTCTTGNQSANHTHGISGGGHWTGGISANHTHGFTTGGMSANASHSHYTTNDYNTRLRGTGAGGARGAYGVTYLDQEFSANLTTSSTNTDHTHSGTTGTVSADHAHWVSDHNHTCGGISANHNHTVPNHTHTITIGASNATNAHNNLQPYITCYMWKRTA